VGSVMHKKGPVVVVLFQLGGPDSLEAVEPFLYNLFSDPDIIDFPFARLARPVMARLISSRRARKVREHYARIGGKSPLRELTERQAAALERELRERLDAGPDGVGARVVVAMRYWHPLTEEAVRQVAELNSRRLVLLPLYPQYSRTTTGSSLNEWQRQFSRSGRNHTDVHVIRAFYDDPAYLDAVVEKVNAGLERFEAGEIRDSQTEIRLPEDVHLVFSAHGVPCDIIEAGDPYQRQIEETVRLVMARGGWANPVHLCYQSRVGPGRWLGPTLEETIRRLASEAVPPANQASLLVVPISFVSDHVETLAEIDLEARALADSLGIGQFELMPALNDSPKFIQALRDLVLAKIGVGRTEHT
jgi:protoporphyrin/coproporphyrin ferrochelatase